MTKGVIPLRPGVLVWLEVHDEDFRTTLYEPTDADILDFCNANNLPFKHLMSIINKALKNGAYGILVNVPEFKKDWLENSTVHLWYDDSDFARAPVCVEPPRDEWVKFDHTAVGRICSDCQDRVGMHIGAKPNENEQEGGQLKP